MTIFWHDRTWNKYHRCCLCSRLQPYHGIHYTYENDTWRYSLNNTERTRLPPKGLATFCRDRQSCRLHQTFGTYPLAKS